MTSIIIWEPYAVSSYEAVNDKYVILISLSRQVSTKYHSDTVVLDLCGWFVAEGVLR